MLHTSSPTISPLVDETRYTHWAKPGWHAWNGHSPEVEVAEFVGRFATEWGFSNIVETGCGQGYFCRALPDRTLHFEANTEFRPTYADSLPTPNFRQIRGADLLVLDSDSPWREREIVWWSEYGKPGSYCFVHDTGNGHPPYVFHTLLGNLVNRMGQPGWFFDNPRGSWLGVHL